VSTSGYRLALDIGTNSIGWCILDLDEVCSPETIRAMGVRIFPDGRDAKSQASLAVDRRLARQMRRRRDRYLRRRSQLMDALIRHGLMPTTAEDRNELEGLDPYALRAKGLQEALSLFELGRVIFHLNQRRGFRSNRKTDKGSEAGKIKPAIKRLHDLMSEAGVSTLGEYLYLRRQSGHTVRSRLVGQGTKAQYEFYPDRSIVEDEFFRLWNAQAAYHPNLSDSARDEFHKIIFYQRPLKPVQPGRCTLEPTKERAPQAFPVSQWFRIYQELNQLRVVTPELHERELTFSERNTLAAILKQGKDLTFESLRTRLKLAPGHAFNLEGESRDKLKGDSTAYLLAKKDHFGPAWHELSPESQHDVVELLLEEESEDTLVAALMGRWQLDEKNARAIAALNLPAGYSRLCLEALCSITKELVKDVILYHEAVKRAGYASHSWFATGEIHERLPYYGLVLQRHVGFGTNHPADRAEVRYGRISNPTVHIALNQVRRVVNELIKLHGHPAQIVLEVARDLKNGLMARREIAKRQAEQKRANDRRRDQLKEFGIPVTGDALMRMRLWEELAENPAARCCPYTGEHVSMQRLFSNEVEVEHVLPFSRTLDNSPSNKTISLRRANMYKGNRSPFEAFGTSADGFDWSGIVSRAALMSSAKRWRFGEDAMSRYEREGDFLDRQLVDTQYIARITREYLTAVCDPCKVWVTPGRLTSLLASRWGFPRKNRDDHRHHALDAALIGVTDRALLKKVADKNSRERSQGVDNFLAGFEAPWNGFRSDVLAAYGGIVVSHKSDHGLGGCLHNETAYGILGPNGSQGNAQHYVPIGAITTPADVLKVKGFGLRASILSSIAGTPIRKCRDLLSRLVSMREREAKEFIRAFVGLDGKEFAKRLNDYATARGMRRVRLKETVTLVAINNREGKPYKGVKGDSNAYYAIYLDPDGRWVGEIVSTLQANSPSYRTRCDELGYPVVTHLFRNDMLELNENGVTKVVYVVRLSEKQIALAEHNEADVDGRTRDKSVDFTLIYKSSPASLQKSGAKIISVSPSGMIHYLEVPTHVAAGRGNSR